MPLPKDPLTRHIQTDELLELLQYEMERARRYRWELGILLIRPVISDEYRDQVYVALKHLAEVCRSVTRKVDHGFRYMNSLVYLLPETPLENLECVAGKVRDGFREALEQAGIEPAQAEGQPCIGVGCRSFAPGQETTARQLLDEVSSTVFLQ